jgi:hypothetical protein
MPNMQSGRQMNVADHLEQHLGQMARGWSSSSMPGVQVCLFLDQPTPGVTTLATLGLSNTVLSMMDGRAVRQELLMAFHGSRPPEEFAQILLHVADQMCRDDRALLRGDIVPLGSRVATDSAADALYASVPVVFPEGFATLKDTIPPTVFVWLIPLLRAEVELIRTSGWTEFEDRLETAEPDLYDLGRGSVA